MQQRVQDWVKDIEEGYKQALKEIQLVQQKINNQIGLLLSYYLMISDDNFA